MKPLIISLGNRYRCDDAAGPRVLDLLSVSVEDRAELLENRGDISSLLTRWQGRDRVILVDAGLSDQARTGQIFCLDGLAEELQTDSPVASSHALDISSAIELARTLDMLPRSLSVYTIVGKNFSHGEELSEAVLLATGQVAEKIRNQLKDSSNDA